MTKFILNCYRKIIPKDIRQKIGEHIKQLKINLKNFQLMKKRRYGKLNKDKTFYVIRVEAEQYWGVFTTCLMVLNNIIYAEEKGWIAVVDYKNYFLCGLQDEKKRGMENAWEYYFEPLNNKFALSEVYKSKNVILGPGRGQPYGSVSWNLDKISNDNYYRLVNKYIHVKSEIRKKAEQFYKKNFPENKKVLGIGIRAGLKWGEMIDRNAYNNHPKGLDIDGYISETYNLMKLYGYEYIFISCDDRYYFERMKKEFGSICIFIERARPHFFEDGYPVADVLDRRKELETQTIMQNNIDYVTEIYLLSKCNSLFAVKGGGAQMAVLFNNKNYDHCIFYDNGMIKEDI